MHITLSSKLVYLSHELVIPAPVLLFNQNFSFVEFFFMLTTEMADDAVEAGALELHLQVNFTGQTDFTKQVTQDRS